MPLIPTSTPQFYPEQQATIAVTNVSASVALGGGGDTFLAYNDGAVNAFIALGVSPTATAGGTATLTNDGGMWIPPGMCMAFRIPDTLISQNVSVAAITASGSTTLRLSRGSGV